MADTSVEQEKSEEYQGLKEKSSKLSDLMAEAKRDVLKASDKEAVKRAIWEYHFFSFAQLQLQEFSERLRYGEVNDSAIREWTNEMLDKICKDGDWEEAKALLEGQISETVIDNDSGEFDLALVQALGLSSQLLVQGMKVFDIGGPNLDERRQTWFDYVRKKIDIVPDKTEPYEYPQMGELKFKVVSL